MKTNLSNNIATTTTAATTTTTKKEKLELWLKKNSNVSSYSHFDDKTSLKTTWNYVTDPNKVKNHSFYPLIKIVLRNYQVSKKAGYLTTKLKMREICIASHFDSSIYKYYNYILNEKYNEYTEKNGIYDCSVAYRSGLSLNNLNISKTAFDFMELNRDCMIIQGDFKGFYDNLDHNYLKQQLCKVLDVPSLPPDWLSVFNSVTKYSVWDMIDILKIKGLLHDDIRKDIRRAHNLAINKNITKPARCIKKRLDRSISKLNGFTPKNKYTFKDKLTMRALSTDEFKKHKKKCIKTNENYGIPQGVSVSSTLSNIYMIEFDKLISENVKKKGGLYLRYSDDFIIILPIKNHLHNNYADRFLKRNLCFLHNVIDGIDGLILEKDKTQFYLFKNNCITNITDPTNKFKSKTDYLGLSFDGKEITIRMRTISKYYTRLYRKMKTIKRCGGVTKFGNKVSCKELYSKYTFQKVSRSKYGNFLHYVHRAGLIYNKDKDSIKRFTKNHKYIVHKSIKRYKKRNNW